MEGVLTNYFENVSVEQFQKEWEEAVGHLPHQIGPTCEDIFREWFGFYYEHEPSSQKIDQIFNQTPELFQGFSFFI